jgi:D-amino-acid dehydrogenase
MLYRIYYGDRRTANRGTQRPVPGIAERGERLLMGDVVVIGAGIIGLSCAYSLRRRGLDVTVVERETPGVGASWGNTGWITRGLSTPLPGPDVRRASIGWLVRRSGPLTIRPWRDLRIPSWLWRFWGKCNERDYAAGLSALAALNERTGELFDALETDGMALGLERRGVLVACRTGARLERVRGDLEVAVADPDADVSVLGREAVRETEPALRDVVGGVLIESDRHLRPETWGGSLLADLQSAGVQTEFGEEILELEREGCRVTGVVGRRNRWPSDLVVLAAGAWSGRLARRMGFALPVLAGKGYSMTVAGPRLSVRRPVYLSEAKIAVSPYPGTLRLSGTMEISGFDLGIDRRRLARMQSAADSFLPGWSRGRECDAWAGLRPITPDGLPVIGRAPGLDNAYVATGHGMLGMTLAPATGEVLATMIEGGRTIDKALERLDPVRFN